MRIFFSTILICAAVIGTASAQPWRDTLWTRTYGSDHLEYFYDGVMTADSGFLLVGMYQGTWGGVQAYFRMFIVFTDASGNEIRRQLYPEINSEDHVAYCVRMRNSYQFILAGTVGYQERDIIAALIDTTGIIQRTCRIGGPSQESANALVQSPAGGWVLCGTTSSYGAGDVDIFLIRLDDELDTLWTRTYGGPLIDSAHDICRAADGNYIVVGGTANFGAGNSDIWLLKVNDDGDTLWTKSYGGAAFDVGFAVSAHPDGGYVVAGSSDSFGTGNRNMYIVRVDESGDTLWTRNFGTAASYEIAYSLAVSPVGDIVAVGRTSHGWPNEDTYVVEMNADGDSLWTSTYGGLRDEAGYKVIHVSDGDFVLCGYTGSYGAGQSDAWLVKIGAGATPHSSPSRPLPRHYDLAAYPNPFNPTTTLRFRLDRLQRVSLVVYDVTGREAARLLDRELPGGEHTVPLDGMPLSSGIYFARLEAASQLQTIKLVLIR